MSSGFGFILQEWSKALTENEKIYVQLRLTTDEAAVLRERGAASNRKLPAEILHRLRASFGRSDPDTETLLFPGWPPVDVERFVALGQVVSVLCARLTLMVGQRVGEGADEIERDLVWSLTVGAIREMLRQLSPERTPLVPFEEQLAASIGRGMATEMRQLATDGMTVIAQQPERAVLAEFARAWGIKTNRDKGDDNG